MSVVYVRCHYATLLEHKNLILLLFLEFTPIIKNDKIYWRVTPSQLRADMDMMGLKTIRHSLNPRQRLKRDLYRYSFHEEYAPRDPGNGKYRRRSLPGSVSHYKSSA